VSVPENISHYPDDALIREAVRDRRMFRPLVSSDRYQLYRFVSPPSVTTAEASTQLQRQLLQ